MVDRRLGRGLEFFLSGSEAEPEQHEELSELDLGSLQPSRYQPRDEIPARELDELARSIRTAGVLQPILVRQLEPGKYEIVAGERRWRAARRAGLEKVPAVVRQITDEQVAVFGLVENLQREGLNAIEKAKAFKRIQELTPEGTHEDVARQVGLDRSTVTNFMRLLELPEEIQLLVSRGTLTMGHARALLSAGSAEEQSELARQVVEGKLSVRKLEAMIQGLDAALEPGKKKPDVGTRSRPVWVNELEDNLVESLGTGVTLRYGKKRSVIQIECLGRDEFERVYELLRQRGGGETEQSA